MATPSFLKFNGKSTSLSGKGVAYPPNLKPSNVETDLEEIRKQVEELKDERVKILEMLGIAVALLTFISVDISIFRNVSDLGSAGAFVLLMFALIVNLLLITDLILAKPGKWLEWRLVTMVLIFIVATISVIFLRNFPLNPTYGTIEFERAFNEKLEQKIIDKLNNDQQKYFSKEEVQKMLQELAAKNNLK